ncbi:hypothetical protein ABZS99_47970 [Streptomyces sp. NPDC005463]|uniref:DinB/UmuC family translesion DNA polymerase n=1 Tax=Streptomyces sp. NPDC005463 TaxID=3154465 RepID=UPI0033BE1DC9
MSLRTREQVARGLTLQLDFAAGTRWTTTLRLPEASAHDEDLRTAAYRLMDRAGLQRGRLAGLFVHAEDLVAAATASEQISFDRPQPRDAAACRAGHGPRQPPLRRGKCHASGPAAQGRVNDRERLPGTTRPTRAGGVPRAGATAGPGPNQALDRRRVQQNGAAMDVGSPAGGDVTR